MRKFATRKIVSTVYVGFYLLIATVIVITVNFQQRRQAQNEAEDKSRILLEHNLAIHTYFTNQLKPGLFTLADGQRGRDYFDPVWMSSTYAVREIDSYYKLLSSADYYYKEAAVNARSPKNEADGFEKAFIEELRRNPRLVDRSLIREIDGKPYFVMMRRGENMENSCLRCHTQAGNAPSELVARYGDQRSFNRSDGELVSVISVRIPLAEAFAAANKLSLELSLLLLLILSLSIAIQFFILDRLLLRPLAIIRNRVNEITADDNLLGEEIHIASSSREVTDFINAFNLLSVSLRSEKDGLLQQVDSRTSQLADKVLELEKALSLVKRLQGIIPICGYCKKIRNDEKIWQQLEEYISENSGALLSHGICPDCYEKYLADFQKFVSTNKPDNESSE